MLTRQMLKVLHYVSAHVYIGRTMTVLNYPIWKRFRKVYTKKYILYYRDMVFVGYETVDSQRGR